MRDADHSPITLRDLFGIFFRSGLSFGAGTAIAGALLRELSDKRGAITRSEFLSLYGLARIVPSGTVTALAVGLGYRYQKVAGTLAVLAGMILPSFVLTVLFTVAYTELAGTRLFAIVNLTLTPAALGVVVIAALRLGREFFRPSVELVLALAGFGAVLLFGLNPPVVLVAGGIIGALTVRQSEAPA